MRQCRMGTSSGTRISFCERIVSSASCDRHEGSQAPICERGARWRASLPARRRSSFVAARSGRAKGVSADTVPLSRAWPSTLRHLFRNATRANHERLIRSYGDTLPLEEFRTGTGWMASNITDRGGSRQELRSRSGQLGADSSTPSSERNRERSAMNLGSLRWRADGRSTVMSNPIAPSSRMRTRSAKRIASSTS